MCYGVRRWWCSAGTGGGGERLPPSSWGWMMCFSRNIYIEVFYLGPFVAATFVAP